MTLQTDSAVTTIRADALSGVRYIPVVHSVDGTIYIPELKLPSDATRDTIVADIASAQHEDISRVIAIDVAAGKSWDASREIAADVLGVLIEERGEVPRWAYDFLSKHLGFTAVNYAVAEAA